MTLNLTLKQESIIVRSLKKHIDLLDNGLKNLDTVGGFNSLREDILEEKRITEELIETLNGC